VVHAGAPGQVVSSAITHALAPVKYGFHPFDRSAYEFPPSFVHVPSHVTGPVASSYEAGWFGGWIHASP
jgi:hypothetical protein